MRIALAINLAMLVVGIAGGIITGSLAVLADAGHVLSDVGAIALALVAARLAARPGGPRRTFGYQRSEVLAALANGLTLVAVAVLIAIEAIGRFSDPPSIEAGGVLALGLFGVAGNAAATLVLARGDRSDINLEGVLRHSAADALGSLGVVIAGAFVLAGGSSLIDPIISLLIAGLILASSWRLIREPVDVLMEAAPPGFDMEELQSVFAAVPGVCSVHDLHVWTLTAGLRRPLGARGRRRGSRSRPDPPQPRGRGPGALRHRPHDPADGGGGEQGAARGRAAASSCVIARSSARTSPSRSQPRLHRSRRSQGRGARLS